MVFDSNEKCSLTQYHAKLTQYLPKTPLATLGKSLSEISKTEGHSKQTGILMLLASYL